MYELLICICFCFSRLQHTFYSTRVYPMNLSSAKKIRMVTGSLEVLLRYVIEFHLYVFNCSHRPESELDSDIPSDPRKWVQYQLKSGQIYISESEPVCQFLYILIVSIIIGSERIFESESDSVS